jgi:acyl-CoA reductase-like NAD-dependent aldehyde dehydrogenase
MTDTATAPPRVTGAQLVAGEERPVLSGADTFQAVDPRTGQPAGTRFAEAGGDDVAAAAAAAAIAFAELRAWPGSRRGALLRDIAARLEEQREASAR